MNQECITRHWTYSLFTFLLSSQLHLGGEEIRAVVDTGANASVVGKCLACKLRIWKNARNVKVRQEVGNILGGKCLINTFFKLMDSSLVLYKFATDAEVLDIGNREIILGLSWIIETRLSLDTQVSYLSNVNSI